MKPHEEYAHLQLVTPKMVQATVLSDVSAYVWARALLFSPSIVAALCAQDPDERRRLRRYRWSSWSAEVLLAVSVSSLVIIAVRHTWWPAAVIVCGVLFCLAMILYRERRHAVAGLIARFVAADAAAAAGVTFYQYTEICFRRYGVPSLVDLVWYQERVLKYAVLMFYLGPFGVFFLPFKVVLAWTAGGYVLAQWAFQAVILGYAFKRCAAGSNK